jgi:hypothetical protein
MMKLRVCAIFVFFSLIIFNENQFSRSLIDTTSVSKLDTVGVDSTFGIKFLNRTFFEKPYVELKQLSQHPLLFVPSGFAEKRGAN